MRQSGTRKYGTHNEPFEWLSLGIQNTKPSSEPCLEGLLRRYSLTIVWTLPSNDPPKDLQTKKAVGVLITFWAIRVGNPDSQEGPDMSPPHKSKRPAYGTYIYYMSQLLLHKCADRSTKNIHEHQIHCCSS